MMLLHLAITDLSLNNFEATIVTTRSKQDLSEVILEPRMIESSSFRLNPSQMKSCHSDTPLSNQR